MILAFVLAPVLGRAAGPFGDLHYRWIGPAVMGGRIDAVAGVPGNPNLIYLGHSSGGLWKSEDAGLTFVSAFESGTGVAVGSIAIDPHDPRHLYVGTGEGFPRNTAVAGDGVWESRDGAAHWRHLGLSDSGSIAKIAIDPADARIVLVAALGHEFGPGGERGIYRSVDGGKQWSRVLHVNATTGGSDLVFAPSGRVAYAGTFDFLRSPWTLRSGGRGSGLYRSSDAGRTWRRLTDVPTPNGLPTGPINRVGVDVCAGDSRVIYAFVPVRNGMLYRSTDGGAHWSMRNASQEINFRPFYFSQVRCDPGNARRVYAVAGALLVSNDGGAHFHDAGGGGDNHDLWIDPADPRRLLNGSDMGFHISLNRGKTWNYDDVVPFDQIYRVGYDMDEPYHVMAGLQDHEVWRGPSARLSREEGVREGDWLNISDWGDGQYAMADPRDSDIIYEDTHFGDLVKANIATGERRYISPQPIVSFGTGAATYRYRFNWSAPLLISHFDPNVIFFGGNVLFRSSNGGENWTAVSPDLTQCLPAQLQSSGGPITHDNTNAETYCTIYSIGEDAKDLKTLWYGTDNGHLEITRNGGASWIDAIQAVGVPLPARVNCIAPSPSFPGVAYASFDRHLWDDYRPYAYVTRDYGRSWSPIGAGLSSFVHVVREDPRNSSVLYAGTENGLFASFDRGASWQDLRLGIPHIPIFDLQVHPRGNDLIVGSHGRGFYILDDLTPLQEYGRVAGVQAYLFSPMPALRYANGFLHEGGRGAFVSEGKPYGALITLYLARVPSPSGGRKPIVHVRVLDATDRQIDAFNVQVHAGFNRFTWDLRTDPPSQTRIVQDERPYYVFYPLTIRGPQVLPGRYTVAVDALGTSQSVPVVVRMDSRERATGADLQAQYDALMSLAVLQERAERAIARIRGWQTGIRSLRKARAPARVLDLAQTLNASLEAQIAQLRNPEPSGYRQPARLSEQVAYLRHTIGQYDGAPTQAQYELLRSYQAQMDAIEGVLSGIGDRVRSLNVLLREEHLPELAS